MFGTEIGSTALGNVCRGGGRELVCLPGQQPADVDPLDRPAVGPATEEAGEEVVERLVRRRPALS